MEVLVRAFVRADIFKYILLDDSGIDKGVGQAAVLMTLERDIRGDAAAVAHRPAVGSLELMCQ